MKVALIHDWLTGMRGGEKVLLELVRMFPSADLFTLVWHRGSVAPEIEERVRWTSFLDRAPAARVNYRYWLPLFPPAIRSLDLSCYDVILSSSHAVAKSVRTPRGALHIAYVHTPMRYIWDRRSDNFRFGHGRLWKRAAVGIVAPFLRHFDKKTAAGIDYFIANSRTVQDRILKCYGAGAEVIYPPVDTDFYTEPAKDQPGDYYLFVSSLEPYKRVDVAIQAFAGGTRRLVIAGSGSLEAEVRRQVRPPIKYVGRVSDERLRELYRGCRALVFPGREDFGIVPVEAQACGRPVLCFGEDGTTESVVHGVSGLHFRRQTAQALQEAVEVSERIRWNHEAIRRHSLKFSRHRFRLQFADFWRRTVPQAAGVYDRLGQDAQTAGL